MIPYEDLCRALDIYNRKLRGEDVPEEAYQEQVIDDDFDIVESADMDVGGVPMDGQYAEGAPDVTAETAVPEADFGGYEQPGSGEYAEGGYDSGAVPGQPADGTTADQYSSGQQAQAEYDPAQQQYPEGYDPAQQQYPEGYDPAQQQYPEGYDPAQQQLAEGYEQAPEQAPEPPPQAYPDDQDPNRQQ